MILFYPMMFLSCILGTLLLRSKLEKDDLHHRSVSKSLFLEEMADLDSFPQLLAEILKETKRRVNIPCMILRDWFDRLRFFTNGPNLISRQYGRVQSSVI